MTLRIFAFFALFAFFARAQSGTSAIYAQLFNQQAATGRSLIFIDARNVGATNHVVQWTTAGGPATCTLLVEKSTDAVSWTTESTQTCTTIGSVTLTDSTYMYLTVNLSALTGGTNPNLTVTYRGYLPGQGIPVRPAEGGTGTVTIFSAGSIPFTTAGGVYTQDNANFFWNATNKRLCLLSNSCVNTLDVGAGKFFVTAAGATTTAELTAKAGAAGNVAGTDQGYSGQTADLRQWKNSAGTVLSRVTSTGVIQPDSGMSLTGRNRFSTVPIGFVAYSSMGTDKSLVAGTIYVCDIFVPRNLTLTGISILNGATVGTDKWIVALYPTAGGAAVANSALAGTSSAGANVFQPIAFTSTYAAIGPARYWIALQSNGTADTIRTVAGSTFIDVLSTAVAGSFGTLPSLTPPTTFTADWGPIAYVY